MKDEILQLAAQEGISAGVAPVERLAGLPGGDAAYILPGARTVIALLHPLDGEIVRGYLSRQDHDTYQAYEPGVNVKLYRVAGEIAAALQARGYRATRVVPNGNYRYKAERKTKNPPQALMRTLLNWLTAEAGPRTQAFKRDLVRRVIYPRVGNVDWDLTPTFSHRYAAVAAGLGAIGWSGNLVTPQYGARVVLDAVVTDAPLEPDPMLTTNPCDGCRTCARVCQSGYIAMKEAEAVTIGGQSYTRNKHGHNIRCTIVCAGLSGQSRWEGWSTYSPLRLKLPETDERIKEFFDQLVLDNLWRHNGTSKALKDLIMIPEMDYDHPPKEQGYTTCTFCRLVCASKREERRESYEMVVKAGANGA